MQMSPRPCLARKLIFSGVTKSAAKTRSPSFSRSSSSTSTTISPPRMATMISAIGLMAAASRRIARFYASLLGGGLLGFRCPAGALADAGGLAGAAAQVVELRPPHVALSLELDGGDEGGIGL